MTYAAERATVGRRPFTIVELRLDYCLNTFSVSPCTATLAGAGLQCYNTRETCQDTANYNPSASTNKIWITSETSDFPADMSSSNVGAIIPCLLSVSTAPTKIELGKGLGQRASVTITAKDFPHSDRGIDKYVDSRTYTPSSQGTFWGKLISRNRYYKNREVVIYSGFLDSNGKYDPLNFTSRTYIIDRIEGPNSSGQVRIVAKDILKLADDKRAKVPAVSNGTLLSNVLAADSSVTVSSGDGPSYDADKHIRINSELIEITSRTGDVLTVTRGVYGTTASDHTAGDTVQSCKSYEAVNCVDVAYDLLRNWAGISESFIPYANDPTYFDEWDEAKNLWLSQHDVTRIISKPTGVASLYEELAQQCLFYTYWDADNQLIKLTAIAPELAAVTYDGDSNIVKDSFSIKEDPEDKFTTIIVNYDTTDQTKKEFSKTVIYVDADAEGSNKFDESTIKEIDATWFTDANFGNALQLGGRLLAILNRIPRTISFDLDVKDDLKTGDVVKVSHRQLQNSDGSNLDLQILITESKEKDKGHTYSYVGQEYIYTGRYGFITPDSMVDFGSATDDEKAQYGFISPDSGIFSDGTAAYKII